MRINTEITPHELSGATDRLFELAAQKVRSIDRSWSPEERSEDGSPVFTVEGQYTSRGWTEWTEGFQYGCALLTFDGSGDEQLLDIGRLRTVERMARHVTHIGVHDHGFNNISTYGNLLRLMREGRIPSNEWEMSFYELAIKSSGAVQASRWSATTDTGGYIYSFNGPHSLFIDTMRTLRVLGLAHQLGHVLFGENDQPISLLKRLVEHGLTSAKYLIWYGEKRDIYDIPGRTAHEGIFNPHNGQFRCPSTQQGYSPFSTWTRGLAWAMLGFAEQLEFLGEVAAEELEAAGVGPSTDVVEAFERAARATCDFYLQHAACADGICYWDTGAPNLHRLGDYRNRSADPFNPFEPVDASAAAIAAQGLIRMARVLDGNDPKYLRAGLSIAQVLFDEPYLSTSPHHQGLLLHSVYHRPNGWDTIPQGQQVPCAESSMWGDYHLLELAVLVQRLAQRQSPYLTFFNSSRSR